MLKFASMMLPDESVATYLISVVPTAKKEPGGKLTARLSSGQLSEVVGAIQSALAPQVFGTLVSVISAGRPCISGNCVSETVTVKESVVEFP